MEQQISVEEVKERFGFDPACIGLRHRGFWVDDEPDVFDVRAGVQPGYLWVSARDGGSNERDPDAPCHLNYVTQFEDDGDCTYVSYIYRPLTDDEKWQLKPEVKVLSRLVDAIEGLEDAGVEIPYNLHSHITTLYNWSKDALEKSKPKTEDNDTDTEGGQ